MNMTVKSSWQSFSIFAGVENPLAIDKDQNRNDELRMIRVLAFDAKKTYEVARFKVLKRVSIEKTFMIFWELIINIRRETAGVH
jgi:hypothetical protein